MHHTHASNASLLAQNHPRITRRCLWLAAAPPHPLSLPFCWSPPLYPPPLSHEQHTRSPFIGAPGHPTSPQRLFGLLVSSPLSPRTNWRALPHHTTLSVVKRGCTGRSTSNKQHHQQQTPLFLHGRARHGAARRGPRACATPTDSISFCSTCCGMLAQPDPHHQPSFFESSYPWGF
jgi:hypothetical protein